MPLLEAEPQLFPNDLLRQPSPPGGAARWWVLHTRPRAEKKLARLLLRRSVGYFLPMYQRQWKSQRRVLRSHLPLFPGYVFLFGDEQDRVRAQETNLLVNYLPVADQPRLHSDLARVHSLTSSGLPVGPEERLEPGAHVVIQSGPLAGLEGKVIGAGRRLTFFVEVEFIRRRVAVEIDRSMIRLLGAAPVQDGPYPPFTDEL